MTKTQHENVMLVADRHWWFVGRQSIIRHVLHEYVEPNADRVVVEVGCGMGNVIAGLSGEYLCEGYDTDEAAIELGKQRRDGRNVALYMGMPNFATLHTADVVLILDVLEHVLHPLPLLRQVVDGLSPGAILMVTAPCDMSLWGSHDTRLGHYRRYTADFLRALITKTGARIELLTHFNYRMYWPMRVARLLQRVHPPSNHVAVPIWPVNDLLRRIFEGEADHVARGRYLYGASLIAVARKE